jgi:transcriptional regulator with XRE-family HTH domain
LGSDRQGDLERGRSGAPVVGPESAEVAARAIAAARTHRGWSQRELARAAHTTQARINGIETATGNPTLRTIAQVLAVLDLELVVRERVGRPTLAPHPMLPFFVARIDHEALAQERGRSVTLRLQPLGGRAMITQILPTDAREGDA